MKMTAPRIARAGRSRFLVCLGILILTIGFVAIFHSSQQQLDELRQVGLKCEQQQESIAAQMQVVVESKFKLEKSLAAERLIHDQTKQELQLKSKEAKDRTDKLLQETKNRFTSLQQNFKLLQSEDEDLKEECAKSKAQQLDEINGLQGKVKTLKGQLSQFERERDKEIEHWKVKYKQLESEKLHLENLLNVKSNNNDNTELKSKIYKFEKIIEEYKSHCAYHPNNLNADQQQVEFPVLQSSHHSKEQLKVINFNSQIPVSEDLYKINLKIVNNTNHVILHDDNSNNHKILNINSNINNYNGGGDTMASSIDNAIEKNGIIINSVENFQMIPKQLNNNNINNNNDMNVLQEPPGMKAKTSTASSNNGGNLNNKNFSNKKTSESNLNNKNLMPIALIPTVTPENKVTKSKKIPNGVVPILQIPNIPNDNENIIESNRYLNAQGDNQNQLNNLNSNNNNKQDEINKRDEINEIENGAHEINDNDFNIIDDSNKNHKDHLQEILDDEKLNVNNNMINNNMNNNNAAEDETNLYDSNKNLENDVDLDIIKKRNKHLLNHHNNNNNKYLANNNDEIAGDQGKVAEYPDDREFHMEDQAEEGDDDDYGNPAARKQDPAVRN